MPEFANYAKLNANPSKDLQGVFWGDIRYMLIVYCREWLGTISFTVPVFRI